MMPNFYHNLCTYSCFSYFISDFEHFVMLSLFHVKALVWSEKWQPSMLTDVVFSSSYPKLLWKQYEKIGCPQIFWLTLYGNHYTRVQNVCPGWKTAGNQGNHQNFDPTLLAKKLWNEAKKIFFLKKKKFKMAGNFSKSPILNIFLWKFHGLVLGFVGLNNAKGIEMAQPIWSSGCPT